MLNTFQFRSWYHTLVTLRNVNCRHWRNELTLAAAVCPGWERPDTRRTWWKSSIRAAALEKLEKVPAKDFRCRLSGSNSPDGRRCKHWVCTKVWRSWLSQYSILLTRMIILPEDDESSMNLIHITQIGWKADGKLRPVKGCNPPWGAWKRFGPGGHQGWVEYQS